MSKTSTEQKKTLFSVLFVACIDNFGFGLVFILFAPLILNPEYGIITGPASTAMRNFLLGGLFLSFPLMQFFGAPLLGDLADRFGRKKAFYISIAMTSLGYLLSALAITWGSYSFLLFSRLLTGFFAGNLSICLASIADLSHDEKSRARHFSYVTIVWGFSWPIAILVGGYLSDRTISSYFSFQLPFYLTTLLSLASLFSIAKLFRETHPEKARLQIDLIKGIHNVMTTVKIHAMRPYFFILLFWTIGWGLTTQWYAAYCLQTFFVSQTTISWGLVLQGIFWVFGSSFINPRLLKRFSTRKTALIGLLIATIFIFASYFTRTFWSFSLTYFTAAIGASFAFSNIMNLLSLSAPNAIQGKAMGLGQSTMSLGWLIVPVFGSILSDIDFVLFYPMAALIVLIGYLILYRQKRLKT